MYALSFKESWIEANVSVKVDEGRPQHSADSTTDFEALSKKFQGPSTKLTFLF